MSRASFPECTALGCDIGGGGRGQYLVPSYSIIRDVLMRVDPEFIDRALLHSSGQFAPQDLSLAFAGNTMCNAIDAYGARRHIVSVSAHDSDTCYTQKRRHPPVAGDPDTLE